MDMAIFKKSITKLVVRLTNKRFLSGSLWGWLGLSSDSRTVLPGAPSFPPSLVVVVNFVPL